MKITISAAAEEENLVKEFFGTYSKIAGSIKKISGPRGGKAKKDVLRRIINDMNELKKLM